MAGALGDCGCAFHGARYVPREHHLSFSVSLNKPQLIPLLHHDNENTLAHLAKGRILNESEVLIRLLYKYLFIESG